MELIYLQKTSQSKYQNFPIFPQILFEISMTKPKQPCNSIMKMFYDVVEYLGVNHSSEKRGSCLMKSSSETLQNLPYFIYLDENPKLIFSFCTTLYFPLINALVYVDIDQGIHQGINKVARNEKRKKQQWIFIYIYIKYGKL